MFAKLKKCSDCEELKSIWKRHQGKLYCKSCWSKHPERKKSEFGKNAKLQAKTFLKKKSSKQQKLDALYSVLRESFLKANPYCKARLLGCQINSTDIHHKCGRGKFMLDSTTFLSVCRICHNQIEENPIMAKAMGFSESREELYGNKEKGTDSE